MEEKSDEKEFHKWWAFHSFIALEIALHKSSTKGISISKAGMFQALLPWEFKLKAINHKKGESASIGFNDFCTLLHSTDSIIKKHKNIKSNYKTARREFENLFRVPKDDCKWWGHKIHLIIWYVTSRQEHFSSFVSAACRCLSRKNGTRSIQIIARVGDWNVFFCNLKRSLDAVW